MIFKMLAVVGVGTPGVVLSALTTWWQWGFRYTVFALFFLYTVIYFMYWFFTDFWDNC
ncbi:MAG: hypothetical protein HY714_01515 [Candidatus Omnitrophica bacterium]|nr:hypothetical protein [Candidatus Omnitrophota bacterium]